MKHTSAQYNITKNSAPKIDELLAQNNESQQVFARRFLRYIFDEAIFHAQPSSFMHNFLPEKPKGRIIVVGAGKAGGSMAASFEQACLNAWDGVLVSGTVVTRYGYNVPTSNIKMLESAHPVPDAASVMAGDALLWELKNLNEDDLVVSLISGGGSALLCAPVEGISLAEKQALNKVLLACGAPIQAMNCIRKHVSKVKGGRLAQAAMPARVMSLLMSDIPGDDISSIASGPTVPDDTTLAMARDYVKKYNMILPESIMAALQDDKNETPKSDDPCFKRTENHLVMTPGVALHAVIKTIEASGMEVLYLGDALEGEASELGRTHAELAIELARKGRRLCIVSGGETTVTLKKNASAKSGKGGRNTEYLLSLALHLRCEPGIYALAGDTDGIDGSEDNAGAIIMPDSLARARSLNIDLDYHLSRNDSYTAFEALSDLVITGPTMTNVNDFRAILILPEGTA